ncbi:hypothetical protein AB0D94_22380 [Streptomyces sp. NPDC048255]|uniref:hypothetical protein n=1 Tax=Streptomyces sp. NPDC048255 TaxID=3154713 RepID=UPI003405CB8F
MRTSAFFSRSVFGFRGRFQIGSHAGCGAYASARACAASLSRAATASILGLSDGVVTDSSSGCGPARRGLDRLLGARRRRRRGGLRSGTASGGSFPVLDGPAQHGRTPCLLRVVTRRQALMLDLVTIRVSAFPEEECGLPLGHRVPGDQADCGQAPARPEPGWNVGFVLGCAQCRARAAVAVADQNAVAVVRPALRPDLPSCEHRAMKHGP